MSNFKKIDVLAACEKYGKILRAPEGINPIALASAISFVESTYGANCGPRYEPAYDEGGKFYLQSPQVRSLVSQYGKLGASSFGPWQTMLVNCPGYSPKELMNDLDACARAFVAHFNSTDVQRFHPETIKDIGEIWNLGHKVVLPKVAPLGTQRYCDDLAKAYSSAPIGVDESSTIGDTYPR